MSPLYPKCHPCTPFCHPERSEGSGGGGSLRRPFDGPAPPQVPRSTRDDSLAARDDIELRAATATIPPSATEVSLPPCTSFCHPCTPFCHPERSEGSGVVGQSTRAVGRASPRPRSLAPLGTTVWRLGMTLSYGQPRQRYHRRPLKSACRCTPFCHPERSEGSGVVGQSTRAVGRASPRPRSLAPLGTTVWRLGMTLSCGQPRQRYHRRPLKSACRPVPHSVTLNGVKGLGWWGSRRELLAGPAPAPGPSLHSGRQFSGSG